MKAYWSYDEITASTERRIKGWMEKGREETLGDFQRALYANWAYGAYMLWETLTLGEQNSGDADRLWELTKYDETSKRADTTISDKGKS